jgi:hypothetical protein
MLVKEVMTMKTNFMLDNKTNENQISFNLIGTSVSK